MQLGTRYDKPENRFTASLVYLLHYLWNESKNNEAKRRIYCSFLNRLCDKEIVWGEQVDLEMQKSERGDEDGEKRILDFEIISSNNILVWVEVKDTASLQDFQRDKRNLERRAKSLGYEDNRLVLLAHYPISEEKIRGIDSVVTWDMLYRWLRDIKGKLHKHGTSHYLINQFLKYLEGKGVLVMNKIDAEHMIGLGDLMNLLNLIKSEAERLFKQKGLKLAETEILNWTEPEEETVSGVPKALENEFLEVWYERAPDIYNQSYEECNQKGSDMIKWLFEKEPGLYKEISSQSFKRVMNEALADTLGAEHDNQDTYVSFRFHKRKDGTGGYAVELWAIDPPVITMIAEEKFVRKEEGKRFEGITLDEGWAYLERPLAKVVEKETPDQQRNEMYRLLAEMYEELEKSKKPVLKIRRKS